MKSHPVGEVPAGFEVHGVGDTWLVLERTRAAELVELRLADPGERQKRFARGPRRGRGRVPVVPLGQGGAVILRRYRHGGVFGRVLGPIFWGPGRALRELQVTTRARKLGAPVPAVGCLVLWPRLGPLWSGVIGTFEESGARDLYEHLLALPAGTPRCHLARRTGAAIRRLHEAGVDHADLQLRNILAVPDPEQERLVIVDLDRAAFGAVAPLDVRRCAQNLGRLGRSLVKNGLWGREVGMREFAQLVAGYTQGNRKLRRELTRWIHWEAAKLRAHRISYPLRSAFGRRAPSPPRRA